MSITNASAKGFDSAGYTLKKHTFAIPDRVFRTVAPLELMMLEAGRLSIGKVYSTKHHIEPITSYSCGCNSW